MKTLPISAFCKVGSGGTPSRSKQQTYYGGSIPWVKSGELRENEILDTEEHITEQALRESSTKIVPKGAVLLAMYGATVGRTAVLGIDAATNQAVCSLVPDPTICDTGYLVHYLRGKVSELLARRVGGAQPNISQGIIKSTLVPIPDLKVQKRIAKTLDLADAILEKRLRAKALMSSLNMSFFSEMFDLRTSPRITLRELVYEFRYGTSTKSGQDGYPVLRIPNVVSGGIQSEDLKFVSLNDAEFERLRLQHGDLLFVRTNGNPDYVGRCAVFEPQEFNCTSLDPAKFVFASYLIRARLKETLISPKYLQQYFESQEGRIALRSGSKTSAGQFNINTQSLGSILIPVPPIDKQLAFADAVGKVQKLQRKMLASLKLTENLYDSLQSRLWSEETATRRELELYV